MYSSLNYGDVVAVRSMWLKNERLLDQQEIVYK